MAALTESRLKLSKALPTGVAQSLFHNKERKASRFIISWAMSGEMHYRLYLKKCHQEMIKK